MLQRIALSRHLTVQVRSSFVQANTIYGCQGHFPTRQFHASWFKGVFGGKKDGAAGDSAGSKENKVSAY